MKSSLSVMAVCGLLVGLSGCNEVGKVTSHYGHGQYRCYYHNELSNKSFTGKSGDRDKAIALAKEACFDAGQQGKKQCFLADCIFR